MDENYKRIKIQKFCQTACLLLFHGLVCADKKSSRVCKQSKPPVSQKHIKFILNLVYAVFLESVFLV